MGFSIMTTGQMMQKNLNPSRIHWQGDGVSRNMSQPCPFSENGGVHYKDFISSRPVLFRSSSRNPIMEVILKITSFSNQTNGIDSKLTDLE